MKEKFKRIYMKNAHVFSELSMSRRLKVGAVVVKDDNIIAWGYNGTPAGWDNNCEDEFLNEDGSVSLVTKVEVLHAEMNSLMKLARSHESGLNATLFCTHSPCVECAKGIYQAGIKEVYYESDYRSTDGVDFLVKCGIKVEKIST